MERPWQIAAAVASDTLLDLLTERGLSEQEANDVLFAIRCIPVTIESEEDFARFCQSLGESLASSAERKDVLAQRIEAA